MNFVHLSHLVVCCWHKKEQLHSGLLCNQANVHSLYIPSNPQQQARGYEQSDLQAEHRSQTHLSGGYIGCSPWGCCVRCIDSSRPPGCRRGERGQISLLRHDLGSRVGCRQLTLLNNHLLHSSAHCKQLCHPNSIKVRYTLQFLQTTQGASLCCPPL
jgi:hypothetical protein